MSICNNVCFIITYNHYLFVIKIFMPINIKTKNFKNHMPHVYIHVAEYSYIVIDYIVVVAKTTMLSSMNGHNQYWMTYYDFSSIFMMKIQAIVSYSYTYNYNLKPLPL
jgi:hypothetical protein